MSVTTVTTAEVAQILADVIDTVPELRVAWWVSDASRPPVAIIAQPSIDYVDPEAPFCFATWVFPVSIVVSRNQDQQAQRDLSRFVSEVALAINSATPDGVFSVEPLDARPTTVTVAGTDLPAYELRVRVRA